MGWLDIASDIGTELYSIASMRNLVQQRLGPPTEKVPAGQVQPPAAQPGKIALLLSRFSLADTVAYDGVIARLEGHPQGREYVKNVSQWLKKNLSSWQQENFRIMIGNLGNQEYILDSTKTIIETPPAQPGGPTASKQEKSEERRGNRGVDFFVSFARCDDQEKMDLCETSGLLSSPLHTLKKLWEKLEPNQDKITLQLKEIQTRILTRKADLRKKWK